MANVKQQDCLIGGTPLPPTQPLPTKNTKLFHQKQQLHTTISCSNCCCYSYKTVFSCNFCMLTQSFTHKSHKITTLTTDSYKQLFALIAMLLTVLNVRPSTFTMAAPLDQPQQYHLQQHNLPYNTFHHPPPHSNHTHQEKPLQETLLAVNIYRQQQNQQHRKLETEIFINRENDFKDMEEAERLRKRDISWHDYYNSIMQSQAISWYNPCGGILMMNEKTMKRKRPPPIKKELRKLKKTVVKNYDTNRDTLYVINIQDMKQWDMGEKYSFLPKLNTNSSISLRRWHRNMQIYVAAFEYLYRAQLYFDYLRDSQESPLARELNYLRKDARNILCNIEHAINNTTTRKSVSNIDSLFISRSRMEEILNFTTNIKFISPLKFYQNHTDDKNCYCYEHLKLRYLMNDPHLHPKCMYVPS
ncbi:uncharacterized protein ACRADG_007993 isoform 2-T2 [Cochliomyia hominivorax]